jgi:hypothetical protein
MYVIIILIPLTQINVNMKKWENIIYNIFNEYNWCFDDWKNHGKGKIVPVLN